jgi:hypothetical protein
MMKGYAVARTASYERYAPVTTSFSVHFSPLLSQKYGYSNKHLKYWRFFVVAQF